MTFAHFIASARDHAGLTRSALCDAAEISRALLYRIEKGETIPSAAVCVRLAAALALDVDETCSRAGHIAPDLAAALVASPAAARAARHALAA